jgi:hypothetical protein
MGSEFRADSAPTLAIKAIGTARITSVEIKKDSRVVHSVKPNEVSVQLDWRDPDFHADRACYYYVRLVQANNEEAICSPIWVN